MITIIQYKTCDGELFEKKEDALHHEQMLALKKLLVEICSSAKREDGNFEINKTDFACVEKIIENHHKIFKMLIRIELSDETSALFKLKNCFNCQNYKTTYDCDICSGYTQDMKSEVCTTCKNCSNWRNDVMEHFCDN